MAKTKNRDRRAVVEQMRREQQRAERRRTIIVISVCVVVAVVIIGLAAMPWSSRTSSSAARWPSSAPAPAPRAARTW